MWKDDRCCWADQRNPSPDLMDRAEHPASPRPHQSRRFEARAETLMGQDHQNNYASLVRWVKRTHVLVSKVSCTKLLYRHGEQDGYRDLPHTEVRILPERICPHLIDLPHMGHLR